jgi:hypothetical protein
MSVLAGSLVWAAETWRVGPEKRLAAFRKPEVIPGELVREWQFAKDIESWVPRGDGIRLSQDPASGHGAKGCLRVQGAQEGGWNYVWSPRLKVEAGASYQASMWLRVETRTENEPANFFFKIEMTLPKPKPPTRVTSNHVSATKVGEWQLMTAHFSVPDGGLDNIAFALEKGGRERRTLDVSIDDVRLEKIPQDFTDSVWRDAALKGPITKELKGVHPRLYLNQARVDYLRKAVKDDPRWAPAMATLLRLADDGVKRGPPDYAKQVKHYGEDKPGSHEQLWQRGVGNRIPHIALAYLLTGDRKYLDSTKAWVLASLDYPTWGVGRMDGMDLAAGHQLAGIGLAYDWLYNDLTPAERTTIREKLIPHVRRLARVGAYEGRAWWKNSYMQNHQWVSLAGMSTSAFALADEVPEAASWIAVAHAKFVRTLELAGSDGASHEGYGYWEYGAEYIMRYLEMARTCLDIALYCDSDGKPHPWFSHNEAYALYLALPQNAWSKRQSVVDIGDCPRYHWYGPSYLLRNLARRYPDSPWRGSAQWLASAFVAANCDAAGGGHYLNFAWYDPEIPEQSPAEAKLPLVHHFQDIDIVSARTAWTGNPTELVVKCGPPLGHDHDGTKQDYGSGHAHPDAGHFLYVADGKILFRDSGYTKPKETGNHSTLLINGKGQKGEGNTWFNFRPWLKDPRSPRIRSVNEKDGKTVVDCDVAPAYPMELGLSQFDRTFSLATAGDLTIDDTVATAKPAEYEWRFQVDGELEQQGDAWLLHNGETTVRIKLSASVPVSVEAATLDIKRHPPYLRVRTRAAVSAAKLRTEIAGE